MLKAFFDTSIFLASLRSPSGGSSEVLRYAVVETVAAFLSDDVVDEMARHIDEVGAELRSLFLQYLAAIPFTLISVTAEDVAWATTFTATKDSPIVAAAASRSSRPGSSWRSSGRAGSARAQVDAGGA